MILSASSAYWIWDSIIYTIELWPRPVFGPMIMNRLGKPWMVAPLVGLRAVTPDFLQVLPITALDEAVGNRGGGLEAGSVDEYIQFVVVPVRGAYPVLCDRLDVIGDQVHVGLVQGGVVVVGHQYPLAAEFIVRHDLAAQDRITDLVVDVAMCDDLCEPQQLRVDQHGQHAGFQHPVQGLALQCLGPSACAGTASVPRSGWAGPASA